MLYWKAALAGFAAACLAFQGSADTPSAAESDTKKVKDAIACIAGEGLEFKADSCFDAANFLGKLDLTSPDNPLFNLMGSSPETIIRPKSGDSFSAAFLPKFADALYADRTSLAIEVNPSLALIPKRYLAEEVLGRAVPGIEGSQRRVDQLKLARRLNPLSLTVAYSESEGAAEIVTYGAGANYILDTGAPFQAMERFARCLAGNYGADDTLLADYQTAERNRILALWRSEPGKHPDPDTPDGITKLEAAVAESLAKDTRYQRLVETRTSSTETCRDESTAWNRDVYGVGLAVLRSEQKDPASTLPPSLRTESRTGVGAWASLSRKLGDSGQLTAGARLSEGLIRERKSNGIDIVEELDSWSAGLRYTHQFAGDAKDLPKRSVRGFVEVAYTDEDFGTGTDSFYQAGIGLEVQLRKNLFFQVVVGDTFDSGIERDNYLSGRVKWAFSNGPAQ